MRRFMAILLAASICLGMASVSLAAEIPTVLQLGATIGISGSDDTYVLRNGELESIDGDTNVVPGDTVCIPVYLSRNPSSESDFDASNLVTSKALLRKYSLSCKRTNDDARLIGDVEWISRKGDFYLAVNLRNTKLDEAATVDATISIKGSDKALIEGAGESGSFDFSIEVGYPEVDLDRRYEFVESEGLIIRSVDTDLKEATLEFMEGVEVTGDFRGNKDLLVRMDTKSDSLLNQYPYAEYRLFKNGRRQTKSLKREVDVSIHYDVENPHLYVVRQGSLIGMYIPGNEHNTATYDNESFHFSTKELEDYILSDEPLIVVPNTPVEESKPESGASSETGASSVAPQEPAKVNPETGGGPIWW